MLTLGYHKLELSYITGGMVSYSMHSNPVAVQARASARRCCPPGGAAFDNGWTQENVPKQAGSAWLTYQYQAASS